MMKNLVFLSLVLLYASSVDAMLAGGRPNAFSEGNNAFAGVVNPANSVWIADRFDVGAFLVHQKDYINNKNNSPIFPPGKTSLTYKVQNIVTADLALHKKVNFNVCLKPIETSFSLATYTVPTVVRLGTKEPLPLAGTSKVRVQNKINVVSAIFSFKVTSSCSLGFTLDYLYFSHLRDGFQNADNPLRSVSPGHVTNNGRDHSHGIGGSVGIRWNITEKLNFGSAWTRKSYGGQYRKYRGYEPHHANNYVPQTLGGGFSYRFTQRMAGRLEVLWSNFGNLPSSNNSFLSNGAPNLNKRGSKKSPGPGAQDATFINMGLGYKLHQYIALGAGYSHRIKLKGSQILSHAYRQQTIYDIVSLGANIKYEKHDIFAVCSYGFRNRLEGSLPKEVGGGKLVTERETISFSLSYGYMY